MFRARSFSTGAVLAVALGATTPVPQAISQTSDAVEDAHGASSHSAVEAEPPLGEEKVLSFGVDEIIVTASPLAKTAEQIAQAVSVLDGEELLLAQQPTLGETLKYMPGLASTYYGPGASRPIIRGLGGDRVRILENGLVTLDASAASDDHAVSIDTLTIERAEVLRGPATLRFGPNAVGGVVNTIDERVPRKRRDELLSGRVELRGGSVDGSFGGAAVLKGGVDSLAYTLIGFGFTSGDLSIPGFARSKQLREVDPLPPGEEAKGTLPNSAVENNGFAAGLSWIGESFFVGAAPSLYRTSYGLVAEPDVTIDLSQNRLDLAGGVTDPFDFIHSIDAKARIVDYHHSEFEGEEVGTTFSNQGYDLRIEAVHHRIGILDGAFGFQSFRSDFSALGEEAFLPVTLTNAQSGFFTEEMHLEPLTVELGGRIDYTTSNSEGGGAFGPARGNSFVTGSGALGLVYAVLPDQTVALNVSYTQRPPNYQELYANGPHVAVDRFEIGNPDFGPERSLGFNVGYLGSEGDFAWSVNGFYNRFWNFLTLFPTGEEEDELPVEVYRGIPAQFAGGEAEIAYHVLDDEVQRLHVVARADGVWAEDRDTGDPLPRIPPVRFGGSVIYGYHAFHAQLDVLRAQPQDRVPTDALPTDGYTMLDLNFTYALPTVGPFDSLLFLRMSNLLDEEARDAASFLKDIAPLPGRNFSGGVRMSF